MMICTKDHSLVQLLVDCGEIRADEVARHPARGQLTHYIGMRGEPLPEAHLLKLCPGDRLLLCIDGLTNMAGDADLLAILKQRVPPKAVCKRLIAAANEAGGKDNITALVLAISRGAI